jgi:hypothetical protein
MDGAVIVGSAKSSSQSTRTSSPTSNITTSYLLKETSATIPPPKPVKLSSQSNLSVRNPTGAKRALLGTKKPRPKRAKQVDNRSTITTTTDTAKKHVNVYDAVLGEAEDLLQAAYQAQALGRLKMASAYQLLLHARLVGLGKRFDRASVLKDPPSDNPPANSEKINDEKKIMVPTNTSVPSTPQQESNNHTSRSTQISAPTENPTTVTELSKYLPSHIELDSSMMEHLARVAMELHHQKTGRKIQSDTPPPVLTPKSTVAWTEAEKHQCQVLLDQGLTEYHISQRMKSRTEAQVKAYLQNQKVRQREARAVEQDFEEENTPRKKGRGRKPPTQAMNTVPNANLDAKTLLSGKTLG